MSASSPPSGGVGDPGDRNIPISALFPKKYGVQVGNIAGVCVSTPAYAPPSSASSVECEGAIGTRLCHSSLPPIRKNFEAVFGKPEKTQDQVCSPVLFFIRHR